MIEQIDIHKLQSIRKVSVKLSPTSVLIGKSESGNQIPARDSLSSQLPLAGDNATARRVDGLGFFRSALNLTYLSNRLQNSRIRQGF
jgi:hypothetical protein